MFPWLVSSLQITSKLERWSIDSDISAPLLGVAISSAPIKNVAERPGGAYPVEIDIR